MTSYSKTIILFLSLVVTAAASAQRVEDNAIADAEDAFGSSVGGEDLGIYSPSEVRGFSPTDAGNVRLEGLYVDRQSEFTGRLVEGNRVRVGPSVLGYAFPAPSGIADYRLRKPADETVISTVAKVDSFGAASLEVDVLLPLRGRRLGLAAGIGVYENDYGFGGTANVLSTAVVGAWRPGATTEVVPFWSRIDIRDEEASPFVIGDGTALPDRLERRRFLGQPWADFEVERLNYGVLTKTHVRDFDIRAGVFRSEDNLSEGYTLLIEDADENMGVERSVTADPGRTSASTSGEVRLSRRFDGKSFDHLFHASFRARSQARRYGGTDSKTLPDAPYGAQSFVARPHFRFGPQSDDRVRQSTVGVAYEGRAHGLGRIHVGLQKSDYQKTVTVHGSALPGSRDQPWLFNVAAAIDLDPRLMIYGGLTRGLEESDVAPEIAVNRDTAPPAIRTWQVDAGLRWRATRTMALIAGVFEVEKPYYGLDPSNFFRRLGDVRHRGIEASINGTPLPGLTMVAGGVFLDAELSGKEVADGLVGQAPVGVPSRKIVVSMDWRPPVFNSVSFDMAAEHTGTQYADLANDVRVPARTTIAVGARYRFALGEAPAVLRVRVTNLFDTYGWKVSGNNVFTYLNPRLVSATLTADF